MLLGTLLLQCLLAVSVLARPSSRDRLAARMAARGHNVARSDEAQGAPQTVPLQRITNVSHPGKANNTAGTIGYSSNWAGAVLNEAAVGYFLIRASYTP